MAQACYAISATNRWAMTGTPIQNRATDFASLIEYLQIQPFSNHKIFDKEIIKPWLRSEERDITRIRKLISRVSLSRTKAVINLPKREDFTHILKFTAKEQEYYNQIQRNTIQKIDEALAHQPLQPREYLNTLQWLNELRLVCNHGLIHSRKHLESNANATQQEGPWNLKIATESFETLAKAGQALCRLCLANLADGTGETANSEFPKPSLSRCLTLICGSCIQNGPRGEKVPTCSCSPKCPKIEVSWAPESTESMLGSSLSSLKIDPVPTKLKALLNALQERASIEKR